MVSNHVYQDVHCNCEALWHTKICLLALQSSTPRELTAAADTLNITNCHMYLYTFVHADASCWLPLYTRRLTINRRTVLHLHTGNIFSYKWGKTKKLYFVTPDYTSNELCKSRMENPATTNSTITAASPTTTTATTNNGELQP